MMERLAEWWRRQTCKHENMIARFKIVEEYGYAYEECPDCGREFYDDD